MTSVANKKIREIRGKKKSSCLWVFRFDVAHRPERSRRSGEKLSAVKNRVTSHVATTLSCVFGLASSVFYPPSVIILRSQVAILPSSVVIFSHSFAILRPPLLPRRVSEDGSPSVFCLRSLVWGLRSYLMLIWAIFPHLPAAEYQVSSIEYQVLKTPSFSLKNLQISPKIPQKTRKFPKKPLKNPSFYSLPATLR